MAWRDFLLQTRRTLIKDRRTYAIAAIIIALGVLEGFGIWTVPQSVWIILNGFGLGYLRAGVKKVSEGLQPPK